jgi:hypothetical protein
MYGKVRSQVAQEENGPPQAPQVAEEDTLEATQEVRLSKDLKEM